jgi:hypothetical protein
VRTRRSSSRSWAERAAVACALVACGVAAPACGDSAGPTILDTEKVERAIERSSLQQRGRETHVSCPSGVPQREDLSFTCTASLPGASAEFVVTQLDGAGRVRYSAR